MKKLLTGNEAVAREPLRQAYTMLLLIQERLVQKF